MEKDVEVLILDDKKYFPLKTIKLNEIVYYILINVEDDKDICVRKEVVEGNDIIISMLDSEEEFKAVLKQYKDEQS